MGICIDGASCIYVADRLATWTVLKPAIDGFKSGWPALKQAGPI